MNPTALDWLVILLLLNSANLYVYIVIIWIRKIRKPKLTINQMLKDIQDFGLQIAEDTDDLEKMSKLEFDKLTFKELHDVELAVRKFHVKYIKQ